MRRATAVIFILVIGGIYLGVFTPTEGAAVGAAGTFIIMLLRQGFKLSLIVASLEEGLRTAAMILLVIVSSIVFSHFLALSGLSTQLADLVVGAEANPYLSLTIALLMLLAAGCVMPATPMILLFVPLFFPIFVVTLGFDEVWFGVIIAVMVEIALITPPIGVNLFAFKSLLREKIKTSDIFKGAIPFVFADIVRLVILIAFPIISLWLPNLMFDF